MSAGVDGMTTVSPGTCASSASSDSECCAPADRPPPDVGDEHVRVGRPLALERQAHADERLGIARVDRPLSMRSTSACGTKGLAYARGPLSLRYAKQALDATADLTTEAGLELEAAFITRSFASEDGQEVAQPFAGIFVLGIATRVPATAGARRARGRSWPRPRRRARSPRACP